MIVHRHKERGLHAMRKQRSGIGEEARDPAQKVIDEIMKFLKLK